MLKVSRFCHTFPDRGFIWHSLTFQKLALPENLINALGSATELTDWLQIAGEHYQSLLSGGFLVGLGQDEELLSRVRSSIAPNEIQNLFLILTTGCNLCCEYCFYKKRTSGLFHRPIEDMSTATAIEAVNLFRKLTSTNHRNRPEYWEQITFYGGEPLLNRNCLFDTIVYVDQLRQDGLIWPNIDLVVNTNGTLIDQEFAQLAAEKRLTVQISIDGEPDIHDANRFYEGGRGSFADVVRGIEILAGNKAKIMPMITVNANNIDHLDQFTDWLCEHYGITGYMMNVLMSTTDNNMIDYPVRAAEAMLKTHLKTSSYGASDENFAGLLKGFSGPNAAKQSCGGGRKITVFPNHEIHTCQAFGGNGITLAGNIEHFSRDNANWQLWQSRSRFDNELCLNCPVLGACGGGCAAGSYHSGQNICSIDHNQCEWTKRLFELWISKESQ